jgi:hypothetical protein
VVCCVCGGLPFLYSAQQTVVQFIDVKSLQSRARAFGDKESDRLNEKWNQFLNVDPDGMALPVTSIKVHHQIWVGVTTSGNPIQVYLHIELYILRFTRPPEQASEHFFKRTMYHDLLWTGSGLVKEMETITDKSSNTKSTETARKMLIPTVAIQPITPPRVKGIIQTSRRLSVSYLHMSTSDHGPRLLRVTCSDRLLCSYCRGACCENRFPIAYVNLLSKCRK